MEMSWFTDLKVGLSQDCINVGMDLYCLLLDEILHKIALVLFHLIGIFASYLNLSGVFI